MPLDYERKVSLDFERRVLVPRLQYKDRQGQVKETAPFYLLQRNQREELVAKRLCTLRRPSRKLIFQRARAEVASAVEQKVGLFWVDNFNRVHFRARPLLREGHVNGTAVAVLPALRAASAGWTGQPSLAMLVRRVADAAAKLRRLEGDFAYLLNGMPLLQLDRLRVPCDVKRTGVRAMDWWPYDIQALNISTSEGLVSVLAYVKQQSALLKLQLSPVLCDVNIFWRILRLMFSQSYVCLDVHASLRDVPLVFGMWHCYVHCIRRVWAVFRPWWMAVEHTELLGDHPEDAKCYDFPSLITLEHTVLALAYHGPLMKAAIIQSKRDVAALSLDVERKEHRLMLLEMLELFLLEYVPCLFHFGIEVRHCYWLGRGEWTGATVRPLLGKFIIFLSKLCWDTPGAFEYSRAALVAWLAWSPMHEQLPGAAHVEECLEASLSRLAAISQHGLHFDQEQDLAMLYCGTCKASTELKDVTKPGVSRKFVDAVGTTLPKILAACKAGTLPFVPQRSISHRSSGTAWPSSPTAIPLRLTISAGHLDYGALLLRALKLVSSPLTKTSKPEDIAFLLDTQLCSGLPALSIHARQLRNLAIEEVNAKLKALLADAPAPKKKAKPAPPPAPVPATSSAADLAVTPPIQPPVVDAQPLLPPARSPSVASSRGEDEADQDLESIQSEDSRVNSEAAEMDDYIVPYTDIAVGEDGLEVDPYALV